MTGKATKVGNGEIQSLKPNTSSESIAEKKCVGPSCDTVTSTPYAKLNNGDYLCSSACAKKHYEKAGTLGAWGSTPTLRVVS